MSPGYRIPLSLILRRGFDALLSKPRSFKRDAELCITTLKNPLRVLGSENVPQQGPCLVVMNHFFKPDFHVWWLAMAISATLSMESRWVITSEWTAPGKWYEPLKGMVSRFVSNRLMRLYGFLNMPPMPPRPQDVEARARSVRAILSYVERTRNPVLCLAPEGADMPGGQLSMPPSGAGRFMLLLSKAGLPITPVGGWEDEDGALYINFGPAFNLEIPARSSSDEKDKAAARQVMEHLAILLPEQIRGEFKCREILQASP